MGVWLGDGTSAKPEITNIDQPIIDYIYQYADTNELQVTHDPKGIQYSLVGVKSDNGRNPNHFWNQLKRYNLVKNKHIPGEYLYNSRNVRLRVLAGIIDTDGYMAHNQYEIMQKSDPLALDIVQLARSLGFKCSHRKVSKRCVKKNGDRVTNLYNRMIISGDCLIDIPVLVDRKKAKPCGKDVNFLITQIDISYFGFGHYTGFQIEGDGQFFGIDYTVLHNSTMCGHLLYKTGTISEHDMENIREEAATDKMTSWSWARVMDVLEEERRRGKTHESSSRQFKWKNREFRLIDTPGHKLFIREMINTLFAESLIGVIVISAYEFGPAFERGQIKEDLMLLRSAGIENLIILYNKMDLIKWDPGILETVSTQVMKFVKTLKFKTVDSVPISAFLGINLVDSEGLPASFALNTKPFLDVLTGVADRTEKPNIEIGQERTGKRFKTKLQLFVIKTIIAAGYRGVVHNYLGENNFTLVVIGGAPFLKSYQSAKVVLELDNPQSLRSKDRMVLRSAENETLGYAIVE